ncbi:tRNA lysidine(34) synthetase TilS [Pseudomonas stutzeri]|uniref:tRNA lysidine(34) synthetase TilS n=1 Tax=Stutzerimonas stutzeri TaxID=316 RepID=UPI002109BE09|nr:tRNA lysidine(34) synthetase TilS [Stutzerimonas stutzeri]MCQ4287983.1 tRNA lysidine(34) synthetase TilS [Stutzerimonas stutzeri]
MTLESHLLCSLKPWLDAPAWRVAFSGGLDSTVLLTALVRLRQQHRLPPLSAVHVHHGLQAVADSWPARCAKICDGLGVPLEVVPVQVAAGASIERAARVARYKAFADKLGEGEVLLMAQHQDDQAETLLFRMLRGAGVRGLGAMPISRALGQGKLVRPLLAIDRADLESYARAQELEWIEDPSNASLVHSRNYLRRQVMPVLKQRWPRAPSSMARTAAHLAEAQSLLDELAEMDLLAARAPDDWPWLPLRSLDLSVLRSLSSARQRNALRHWLADFTLLPDTDHWAGWEALRDAAVDATPRWRLEGGELHRAGRRLWWLYGPWLEAVAGAFPLERRVTTLALAGNGAVSLEGAMQGAFEIRYRQGGESMTVPGRGRRDLKRLLNEAQVPGFVRSRLPLLYLDGELIAIANLPQFDVAPVSLVWTPPA